MEPSRNERIVSGINLTNLIVLMIIAILSYNVSSQVASLQSEAAENQRAKDLNGFWTEVHTIIKASNKISGKLGSSVAKFQITAAELAENYLRARKTHQNNLLVNDLVFAERYTSFIGAYASLQKDIETAGIEYDFFRVKYHNLALQYEIVGWAGFLDKAAEMNTWKQESLDVINPIFQLLNQLVQNPTNEMTDKELESILVSYAKKLGTALFIYQLPYADAAYKFMGKNLISYQEKLEETVP